MPNMSRNANNEKQNVRNEARIKELITQLGSDNLQIRENAQKILEPIMQQLVKQSGKGFIPWGLKPELIPAKLPRQNCLGINEVKSDILDKYFAGYDLFCVSQFNPQSLRAGRSYFYHSMVISPDSQISMLSDVKDCVEWLNQHLKIKELGQETALEIMQLYAQLRQCKIVESEYSVNPPNIKEEKNNFLITFYILDDPEIIGINEGIMIISKDGKINITEKHFSAQSGYD